MNVRVHQCTGRKQATGEASRQTNKHTNEQACMGASKHANTMNVETSVGETEGGRAQNVRER